MEATKISFQETKEAYLTMYGEFYNVEFDSFDNAFLSAWNSFDYVNNAYDEYLLAEAMSNCWQLTES